MQKNALFKVARRGHCSLLRRKFKFATCLITRVDFKVPLGVMTFRTCVDVILLCA